MPRVEDGRTRGRLNDPVDRKPGNPATRQRNPCDVNVRRPTPVTVHGQEGGGNAPSSNFGGWTPGNVGLGNAERSTQPLAGGGFGCLRGHWSMCPVNFS